MTRPASLLLCAALLLAGCFGTTSTEQESSAQPVDETVAPAGTLSDESLANAYDAFDVVAEEARAGDVDSAEGTFIREAHDITHVIDLELLSVPEQEAVRQALYNNVLAIEVELLGERRPEVIATSAEASQAALADAAEALGYQRPQ
jgi:hypothetical protein